MKFEIISELLDLFFPRYCLICGQRLLTKEKHLCLSCLGELDFIDLSIKGLNKTEERMAGRFLFKEAASLFYFRKEQDTQKLIHAIKYRNAKETGEFFGRMFAELLVQNQRFISIDAIVPVPIHPNKEKKRGYNQSEVIAQGLSTILKKPIITHNLIKIKETDSQTHHNKEERWKNVQGSFQISRPSELEGKHILLVDDVLTTGATLETCGRLLATVSNIQISFITLMITEK